MNLDRAFLAVPVPEQVCQAVAELQSQLASRTTNLRWVRPDSLHLTLHFFGRVAEENLEKIKASMLSVGLRTEPFQVDIRGLGVFPNSRRPRVLWLGLEPEEPLMALSAAWQEALSPTGLPPGDRPFSPHLTIGRFRQRGNRPDTLLSGQGDHPLIGTLPVDRLVLYESRLTPRRAEHRPVHSVSLGAGPSLNTG